MQCLQSTAPNTTLNFGKHYSYEMYLKQIHSAYNKQSVLKIISENINSNTKIGSGFSADVYRDRQISDYLYRIERNRFKPQTSFNIELQGINTSPDVPNFGQPVATNNNGLNIIKKVNGKSHSIPNWTQRILGMFNRNENLSHSEIRYIIDETQEISSYPEKSFEQLARKIKMLSLNSENEIDFFNTNNLLIDKPNKTFNIVDLWEKSTVGGNGTDSVVALFLDPLMHNEVLSALGQKDKKTFIENGKIIIEKILNSCEKAGLKRNQDYVSGAYTKFDNKRHCDWAAPRFDEFKYTFRDDLKE